MAGEDQVDAFMRAISSHEGSTNSVNPDSGAQGSFQILPGNWPSWAQQAGADPNDRSQANQEKVARAEMLRLYAQFGNWRDVAIAWYGGPGAVGYSDAAKNAPQGGGKYPSINSYANGVMRTMGGPNAVPTNQQPTSGTPSSSTAPTKFSLPSDAQIFVIDGRMPIVMFDLGDDIWVKYSIRDFSAINHGDFQVHQISGAQLNSMKPVDAGDASELGSTSQTWGSYSNYWQHEILSQFPPNSTAAQDPGVRRVIAEAAARPPSDPMTEAELRNRLLGTDYVQGKSDQARTYDNSTAAERQQMVQKEAQNLAHLWEADVGQPISILDPRIQAWATDVASGHTGEGSILYQQIIPTARATAGSPRQRQDQAEQKASHQNTNDITTKAAEVTGLFHRWGIQGDTGLSSQWASDIVNGKKSDGDLLTYLQGQSKILYPWKDPVTETQSAAQPWMSTYNRVMENDPTNGIFDPSIQKALNNGTPLWQFEQDLKQDPRWLQTDNARSAMDSSFMAVGKTMGFE